ncbi:RagB/SusD family nutrient uptake outer membrane protein [Larkinella terrae]|uniref:RagB/SusD family nutrient uptake outer membrane protein n=1 Tax=Larkinella terrae TaxID=2025311 RepID=A0A7K0EJJ9_9BACT|nr:RagB/SusD family nutrient uptake outer membrane protein [Larkinella terrae]MRS61997.1 RagB/SusD family nutrient uptake outer membrane protein [Larkinella terrae]
MKRIVTRYFRAVFGLGSLLILSLWLVACKDNFLDEKPLASLSSDVVLTTKAGFDNYITALHQAAREELSYEDNHDYYFTLHSGTDIATTGQEDARPFRNYVTYLTPAANTVTKYWMWAYKLMLVRANTIIVYANKPELKGIWTSEAEKNAILAEARFFRAYTHNALANLYGGVPIVDTIYTGPKTDFVRNTRKQVYEAARADLEFASQWLPATVDKSQEGRIVKAAADHLLTEVYMSLGEHDKAIASASRVIDSGLYKLMTSRFGSEKDLPGDAYSDLFKLGNQNRSSGNLESIYVWQFEDQTPGGQGGTAGNNILRGWGPWYINLRDPEGKAGMIIVDSLGRGVGLTRPTTYFLYNLWEGNWTNDMRNSPYNIRRTMYYTNPASAFFRKPVEAKTTRIDTMQNLYPTLRKIEGKVGKSGNNTTGRTFSDFIVYRLAETYLLRAEAQFRKGDLAKAAADINVVRARANAKPVAASSVTIDYILDERARELIAEEPRRRTLIRMGKLVERTRKYNMREDTRSSIQNYHEFFPIPQTAIDANFSAKLEQNPGY